METDHKPLRAIFNKPIATASPGLQRMLVRLQRYSLKVSYNRGTSRCVSLMRCRGRISLTETLLLEQKMDMEVLVHTFYDSMPVSRAKKEEIARATKADATLQKRSSYLECTGRNHGNQRHLISWRQLIIPTDMRPAMLKVLHEGHMGMEKTKTRPRFILYWPNMGKRSTSNTWSLSAQHALGSAKKTKRSLLNSARYQPDHGRQNLLTSCHSKAATISWKRTITPNVQRSRCFKTRPLAHMKSIFARHEIPEKLI